MDNRKPGTIPWEEVPAFQWRLYKETLTSQGYYLMISRPPPDGRALGPQSVPFLKPGVDSIFEQLEKPNPDIDRIEVALMKFEGKFLEQVRNCLSSGKPRQARLLWEEQDLRFQVITDSMWETLVEILRPTVGPRKTGLRMFAERYIKVHARELSEMSRTEAVKKIYFYAKKEKLGTENRENDRRVIRLAFDDFFPLSKNERARKS